MRSYKKPVFTTRHYEMIAEFLKQHLGEDFIEFSFVEFFEKDNPKFSEEKFLRACGAIGYDRKS